MIRNSSGSYWNSKRGKESHQSRQNIVVSSLGHSEVFHLVQERQIALLGVQVNDHNDFVVFMLVHVVHVARTLNSP